MDYVSVAAQPQIKTIADIDVKSDLLICDHKAAIKINHSLTSGGDIYVVGHSFDVAEGVKLKAKGKVILLAECCFSPIPSVRRIDIDAPEGGQYGNSEIALSIPPHLLEGRYLTLEAMRHLEIGSSLEVWQKS